MMKINEPTKEFVEFFATFTSAFNKPYNEIDLNTWWRKIGYSSENLEEAHEKQALLYKTYDLLPEPGEDAETKFPSIPMFLKARLSILQRQKLENNSELLSIEDNRTRNDEEIKKSIKKFISLYKSEGPKPISLCDKPTHFYENGKQGIITTDKDGKSIVTYK